jgi:hypothetical protein
LSKRVIEIVLDLYAIVSKVYRFDCDGSILKVSSKMDVLNLNEVSCRFS